MTSFATPLPLADKPILGNVPQMKFCYETKPLDWSSYYLIPDAPPTIAPQEHRPTWKGVGKTPNQRPATLAEVAPVDRPSLTTGFIPHAGEYRHFATSVDAESSLRNLDQSLTKQAFGQRILPHRATPESHPTIGLLPDHRAKGKSLYAESPDRYSECSLERKFDAGPLNQARFNNSSRLTTKNLTLPYTRPAKQYPLTKPSSIGGVPAGYPLR
jgi:hypothetical protein